MARSWRSLRAIVVLGGLVSAVLALTAGPAWASGQRLHVSVARGSDSNPCTAVEPCKTIGRAVKLAEPGDAVLVARGTYPESVTVDKRLRLIGHHATIDASGKINGLVVSGTGAAGSLIKGLTVKNAIAEGILVQSTSYVLLLRNSVENNDQGHDTPVTPQCTPVGEVPGDCGEALHLMGVTHSRVTGNLLAHNIGGILITDETGPSRGNLILNNVSRDNAEDCGITLPSHNPDAVAHPDKAGVYDNWIIGNLSERNGGAGVGMFAPAPGTASYRNHVIGNTTLDNGEAGIAIHAHAPGQNVSANVIVGNRVAGNGIDPDSGSGHPTGIALFSAAVPAREVVAANRISKEYFGIFIAGPVTALGLRSNHFSDVTVPVGHP
jgi:nitrous oxidase accessory protein NosD